MVARDRVHGATTAASSADRVAPCTPEDPAATSSAPDAELVALCTRNRSLRRSPQLARAEGGALADRPGGSAALGVAAAWRCLSSAGAERGRGDGPRLPAADRGGGHSVADDDPGCQRPTPASVGVLRSRSPCGDVRTNPGHVAGARSSQSRYGPRPRCPRRATRALTRRSLCNQGRMRSRPSCERRNKCGHDRNGGHGERHRGPERSHTRRAAANCGEPWSRTRKRWPRRPRERAPNRNARSAHADRRRVLSGRRLQDIVDRVGVLRPECVGRVRTGVVVAD